MKFKMANVQKMIDMAKDGYTPDNAYVNGLHDDSTKLVGHTQPYYPLFYLLANRLAPEFVLELGSWRAYGAGHFAAGNPFGKVATIDIHKDDPLAKQITIDVANHLTNLTYFNMWTWDAVPALQEVYGPDFKIDILFIDAWHTYEYAMREWNLYKPFLADEALVICDDLFNGPGACEMMIEWWDDVVKEPIVKETIVDAGLHPGIPMGFMRIVK